MDPSGDRQFWKRLSMSHLFVNADKPLHLQRMRSSLLLRMHFRGLHDVRHGFLSTLQVLIFFFLGVLKWSRKCLLLYCNCVFNRHIAATLITSLTLLPRREVTLENYVRAAFLNVLIDVYKTVTPACAVHQERALEIYCLDCDEEGCTKCWM